MTLLDLLQVPTVIFGMATLFEILFHFEFNTFIIISLLIKIIKKQFQL